MALAGNQMQPQRPQTQKAGHLVDLALKAQQAIVASNAIGAAVLSFQPDAKRLLHLVRMPGHGGLIATELVGSVFSRA
jgi:hypothetical protein